MAIEKSSMLSSDLESEVCLKLFTVAIRLTKGAWPLGLLSKKQEAVRFQSIG